MPVITISREMGTGAYHIASEVARKLKYTLVDGPAIADMCVRFGLTPDILQRVDEKPPAYITAQDRLNAAYLNMIEVALLETARKGNVILYGRGGQDLMKGLGNVLRVRFIAPFEHRVENFAEREWIDPDLARDIIRKSDHQRGGFIHFYFDRNWNDPLGYDLIFNTARISHSSIIESIMTAVRDPRLKEAEAESLEILEDIIACKRVETAILKSPDVENLHFRITAEEGVVTLAGHVHSEEEKDAALSAAMKAEGVAKVVDSLQVAMYKNYKE